MQIEFRLVIDKDKVTGLDYVKKVIDTMKILTYDMPPELKPHCLITLNRMQELAESLEIGWRKWVADDFNRSLATHPLLQAMSCRDCKESYFPDNDDL